MPTTSFDVASIKASVVGKLQRYNGATIEDATPQQIYKAVAITVRDQIMQKWMEGKRERREWKTKRLYYLSVEFLTGRSLLCNLINLCSTAEYKQALSELGVKLSDILPEEPEPALGNGGLGRLAACFLDSLASCDLTAMGCTIRYEYGIFKQKMVDGQQVELPDEWLKNGNVWERAVMEDVCTVRFGGRVEQSEQDGRLAFRRVDTYDIEAVPYDVPAVGYATDTVNTLRMWSARSTKNLNLRTFGAGEYAKAREEIELAEVISKVLYPEDNHYEGKLLRLKQHYFFTSATLQYAIGDFKKTFGTRWELLPEKVIFHINDTHPGLAIPELMRILIDDEGLSWEKAESLTRRCVAYTNHTVMDEALERWPVDMVRQLLPRVFMILEEINRRLCARLWDHFPGQWDRIAGMAVIAYNQVQMANLCVAMSCSVNGVSRLHTEILTQRLFHDYYAISPQKFHSITNGITHRRWLLASNPALCDLISDAIGEKFITDPIALRDLAPFADDAAFVERFDRVKQDNKRRLQKLIRDRQGIDIDTGFIFDVQAKRLHEYKRQMLNALHILVLYNRIVDDAAYEIPPRLFLFGAKASPGYAQAKLIIRFINALATLIDKHPRARRMLKVVFIENYDVSTAQVLMPAAEISQQLSTAGKEASGTGNMKFMMNGAVTLGTMDGANVEIWEQVGDDNIYIFGMRADTVADLYKEGTYNPMTIFETNAEIRKAMSQLIDGTILPEAPGALQELYHTLLVGASGSIGDPYFVLKDFGSYSMANRRMMADYQNRAAWLRKAVLNVARSGVFSSDRTIQVYNDTIWHIQPTK